LAAPVNEVIRTKTSSGEALRGILNAGDFDQHWISSTQAVFTITLEESMFTVDIVTTNAGRELVPMGIGWHPYLAIPSRQRAQARMHIPATARLEVNNYDEVFPTGRILDVENTLYDFSPAAGAAIGNLALDDCYVKLLQSAVGETILCLTDPAANYGVRVTAVSPHISAVQVYAPSDSLFVALEPQFNWPDPYGAQWQSKHGKGMVVLAPGESVRYAVRLELFEPSMAPSPS
jgi:galactose mutarotase-like enzyme